MKSHTALKYLALSLAFIILHTSAPVVDASDVILSSAALTCDCCYVSISSECCLDCLSRVTEVGGVASLATLLMREGEIVDNMGTSSSGGGVREAVTFLPGCRCCFREKLLHQRKRHTIIGASCCSLCQQSKQTALKIASDNASAYGGGSGGAIAGGDDAAGGGGGGSGVQKRMSMDCMCCSNSGIADCCSKCRLMV